MRPRTIVDTGPLVAFLDRRDRYHSWVRSNLQTVAPPLETCEAVLSEACFLLQRIPGGPQALFELLSRRLVTIPFSLRAETDAVQHLLGKYSNLPMSLADACLVRMTELYRESVVVTLDSDFVIYRRGGSSVIPTLRPHDR